MKKNQSRIEKESKRKKRKEVFLFLTAFFFLPLSFTFLYSAPAALPGVPSKERATEPAQKNPTVPQGQLPEVVIKGSGKTGVESEKPLLQIEMNPNEAILPTMDIEEDLLQRQPESLRDPRAGFSKILSNPRTILPARIRLAKDPVKTFYPLRDIMAISPSLSQEIGTGWEFVVTDTDGRPFRKFSGGGLPQGTLRWNGRSDKGEVIRVGQTYSTVINYKDTRGQGRNFVGEPFSFDGVLHQETKGLTISLALSALFQQKFDSKESETIGESGTTLLQETSDWIKRYYFTYPIRVECYSQDATLAMARAQAVAKFLSSLLLLPRGEITANGSASDLNSERVDVIIANR